MKPGTGPRVMPLLLLVLLAAGCVSVTPAGSPGTGGPVTTTAPGATQAPDTPWEAELDDVAPDGTRSLESSLRLFAMAYGPIPGVEVPDSTETVEGTIALRHVRAHYDELTPEQRAAVDVWLAPEPDAPSFEIGPVTQGQIASRGAGAVLGANSVAATDLNAVQKAIQSATDEYRAAIAAKIGDIPGQIKVSFPEKQEPDALADADGIWTGGGYGGCEIRWFKSGLIDVTQEILLTAAHETFHCFQAANIGKEFPYLLAPDWYQEGGAEWASWDIVGTPPTNDRFWRGYVDYPAQTLFERTYDGAGFWADLAATGIDPWPKWKAIWAAYANEGAWVATGGEADAFLDSWASGWFRDPSRGAAWDMTGPGIPDGRNHPESASVANGSTANVATAPYSNAQYLVNSSADVLVFTGNGHIRVSDRSVDEPQPFGLHFCTKSGGCNCPDGKPPPFAVTNLAPAFAVAVTGGSSGASANISGIKLEDACKEPEEQKAVIVKVDRPGTEGVLPGTVVDLLSCDGPYGTWTGVFRTGGLSLDGFEVPWTDLPVTFTFPAEGGTQTAVTTTSAVVHTPIGDTPLDYVVTVTTTGGQMTIVLEPGSEGLDNQLVNIPVQPAPEGACPA